MIRCIGFLSFLFPVFVSIPEVSPAVAQAPSGIPVSASARAVHVPEYDVEATSRVLEETVTQLEPFTYSVELSWEGAQQWISLESPEIEWPDGVIQLEASQKTGSSIGERGPLGTKSFNYRLEAQKAGDIRIPTVRIHLLAPGTEDPITVEAPGTTIAVLERIPPASEKVSAFLKEYGYLILGVCLLILLAVVFGVAKYRKDNRAQEAVPDPWVPIEEELAKAGSLRGAGRDREYYERLERAVLDALDLAVGGAVSKSAEAGTIEGLPLAAAEDLQTLLGECSERKYRPDRPRPEEMDRSLRQAQSVVKALKELHDKRGTEA